MRDCIARQLYMMGQLGLGEDWNHISTPCLLNYSQLAEVTQIHAGHSYSAAITACGELLLWGQIPCVSRVSDPPGLKNLWTPQPVPLADTKVCDVACGTWHMMALTTTSREKNRERAHSETEARFGDLVSDLLPTEQLEKENTVQDSRQAQHKLLHGPEGPEGSEEQENDEESESAEEEERPNKDEGDGALRDSAFAIARSSTGMDRRGNGHSSIKSDQRNKRESCRTVGPWELSRRSTDIVFTTLHLLPRSEGEQCRPSASSLPWLLTGQQAHGPVLAEARKERFTHLTELVQKSGSDSSILQSPSLTPKPRPPGRRSGPAGRNVASCHRSRIRPHTGVRSPMYNSSPLLSRGQQVQMLCPSFHPGPQVRTSLSPPPSSSELLRYCPTHRRAVSSFGTSRKDL
ncbi:uncharacterized protein LOC115013638 [Cottoperca gobio]|uniref:Uncharacterized protein LOC115013638 n=1 Tax=Cottoperca gobio TaxID=56716 RepID=A0A6J2QD91_COTGO|nr:uncharacterized protein LOC115013638 [Cottoperca gobio]